MINFVEAIDTNGRLVNPVYPAVFAGEAMWLIRGSFPISHYGDILETWNGYDMEDLEIVLPIEV